MAAAAELLGKTGDIHLAFASQADPDGRSIGWLDHEDRYFDRANLQGDIDQVLGIRKTARVTSKSDFRTHITARRPPASSSRDSWTSVCKARRSARSF